jgi:Outer membrane protein beta-barrel domain
MKKAILLSVFLSAGVVLFAQDEPKPNPKPKQNLRSRANDHLLIELGVTNWAGAPDSIKTKGLSRSFNAYFMFDFPFKSNPHLSVGIGAGIGTDNIYFNKTYVGIKDATATLRFQNQADTNHFKKNKLATATLEAPVELRYSSNPAEPNKSYKFALGIKAGVLLNAHLKQKTWQNKTGQTLLAYTEKQSSKRFFNSNRFVATARFGYGVFGIFGTYQLNTVFKTGFAPDVRPYTIGLVLSGL